MGSSRHADAVSVSLMLKKWTVGNPLGSCEHQQGPWKLWPLSGKLSSFDFPWVWAYLLIREGHWPARSCDRTSFFSVFPSIMSQLVLRSIYGMFTFGHLSELNTKGVKSVSLRFLPLPDLRQFRFPPQAPGQVTFVFWLLRNFSCFFFGESIVLGILLHIYVK